MLPPGRFCLDPHSSSFLPSSVINWLYLVRATSLFRCPFRPLGSARPTFTQLAMVLALSLLALAASVSASHVAPNHARGMATASAPASTITARAQAPAALAQLQERDANSPLPLTDYHYAYSAVVSLFLRSPRKSSMLTFDRCAQPCASRRLAAVPAHREQ